MALLQSILQNKRVLISLGLLLAVYLLLLFIFREYGISREQINSFLAPLGYWGLLAAFLIQILTSMTPLPDAPLAFATMILYGPYIGSITIFVAMLIATAINYMIAHKLGKKYILRRFPQTAGYLNNYGQNASVESLVLLRFFSFLTFDIVSYIAALSGVSFSKFMFSSVIGLIPLVISHALVSQGLFASSPLELLVLWSIPALILLSASVARRILQGR
ncbi:MAG: VTT domain-containing protein [Candidatus Dojkabacteria bacterium]|uniref:TVP38/TMEM64 family membrane protein n=2 Tax=Candidatus Dojkabacteria TaxID=74243 RepID=A0A136KKW5_9BACT|nr:MAG: TVP38/TMEM64 family inner membrane protein YdjZ [candidate division WS6 bacterium OLB21]MBW7954158.1 VTT domain-containing protein [Candidatus Dojkabacteria bacterium]WKZ28046.1 MAG: VTT domain-containing protein [Candidatus Dojkabacteria bacterium]